MFEKFGLSLKGILKDSHISFKNVVTFRIYFQFIEKDRSPFRVI